MAKSVPALVERSVLRWARESVGLVPVAAARKIGVADDRVAAWEAGDATPTIVQLRKAAEVYKRPLAVFFLTEPPEDFDVMRDFRRVAGTVEAPWTPELHAEYRRAISQRNSAIELAEIDEAPPAEGWRVPSAESEPTELLGARLRATLTKEAPLEMPRGSATKYDHLNYWIAALEQLGVLVMATSGGRVRVSEMRAFSLFFDTLPIIMANGSDSVRGRLFSVMHEYAHLVLHTSGLCDTTVDLKFNSPNRALEARCNAIAASILMPRDAVLQAEARFRTLAGFQGWTYQELREAANPFGVSAEAFLRRLATFDLVGQDFYRARREEFIARYEEEEKNSGSSGNWYRNKVRDLGKGYVRAIAEARRRRVIDSFTAASFLDVKVDQIDRLEATARLSEPA